jgi:glycosyltransferase involved in cell wall biosynthesis
MAQTAKGKIPVYVDGDAIVTDRPSGIGTTIVSLIRALSTNEEFLSRYELRVIIAVNKLDKLPRWNFNSNVKIRKRLIIGRILNGLVKFHLLPPMDIVFGRGIYIFPNFRNWPLAWSPSVTYIHDVSFKVYPEYVEPRNLRLLEKNVGLWIDRTDKVVTVSEFAKKDIIKYFTLSNEKVEVVYNGIDDTFRPLTEAEVAPVLASYDLPYKKYFMFLSNLEPRKNLKGVLDGFKLYCDQQGKDSAALFLVGGMAWGNEDSIRQMEFMMKQGYKVIRPDHYVPDSDLPMLINGSAALVSPAFYEGFGISPLQAMACGVQVVVSRTTSLPEVVGDTGIYVDAHDAQSIADGFKQAYKKRDIRNEGGVKRAHKFTWRASGERLTSILMELKRGEL